MTDATTGARLRVTDFDYQLPARAIAQVPAEPRDAARLLVLDRASSQPGRPSLSHHVFRQIGDMLLSPDLLVVNDSRVLPARLLAQRDTGGGAELLMLRPLPDGSGRWEGLVKPSRRVGIGDYLRLTSGDRVEVGERLGDGTRVIRFFRDPLSVMNAAGEMPLPPYIRDRSAPPDRYQTVYARPAGSAAAPTAGLHFTPSLLGSLAERGIGRAAVTLHVGLDTFRPLEGDFIDEHRLHREWYEIPSRTRTAIRTAREGGGRVVAVGTTTARVLETATSRRAARGWSDLYITPGHAFAAVDALVTNFHLPRSSLLVMVTAFVQSGMPRAPSAYDARNTLLAAYRVALEAGYRFFSFGDAMLIV